MAGSHKPTSDNGTNPHKRRAVEVSQSDNLYLPIAFRGVNTLEIIDHATKRMKERHGTEEDVKRTLERPDEERDSLSMPGRREAFWNKTAMIRIKVVFEQLPVGSAGVLNAPIRMMDQPFGSLPVQQCHRQSLND